MSSIDASSTPPSSDQDENRPDRKAEKVEGTEGGAALSSSYPPVLENDRPLPDQNTGGAGKDIGANFGLDDGNEVRAPLPVKRDVLYDHAVLYGASRMGYPSHEAHSVVPFRNFDEEMKRSGIWESEQGGTSTTDNSRDNLASLYRPPFALMHLGPFEKAKDAAKVQNKWLLVNLQSTIEFSSHMLNRDTWANEAVAQTISSNFIFWQVYDDTEEGRKVCTYYKLESIPVILVIDPITGQKMRSWRGMILPESLLEDLLPFMDGNPSDHHFSLSHKRPRGSSQTPHKTPESPVGANETNEEEDEELLLALAVSMESMKDTSGVTFKDEDVDKEIINEDKEEEKLSTKKFTYPPLPEEPQGDRTLLCRVGVRLPDGRRLQRNFLRSDPIKLMWSFCYSKLEEGELRQLRLTQAIPGASKLLDYDSNLTFENSGLANSMISVTWE